MSAVVLTGETEIPDELRFFDAETIRYVRAQLVEHAQALRDAANVIEHTHITALEAAALPDWISSARLTYDSTRWGIRQLLELAVSSANFVAWQYEAMMPVLDMTAAASDWLLP